MAYRGVEQDIQRAKELRKLSLGLKDTGAKHSLEAAADRLERRAARKANHVGKKRRKPGNVATTR